MIRKKKDYSFLRMLALITQLGISMLTCIFLCMIAGKASCRLDFSGISYIGNTGRISFLLYDNFAFYKIDCFILNNIMCIIFWS